jgi:small subunit ribosomal protein S16
VGKKKTPMYRVVVADERAPRDGRFIEIIGQYQPLNDPSMINIKDERALYWLGQGAQPTETVQKILIASGVWEQYEKSRPKKSLEKAAAKTKALAKGREIAQAAHAAKKAPKVEDAPAAEEAPAEATTEPETTESE